MEINTSQPKQKASQPQEASEQPKARDEQHTTVPTIWCASTGGEGCGSA
jgi:hypothetical protein